ncbi:MAG: hypothetical protein KC442_19085 [Thermomicrobiales bacterium]|nr:hypothetical protein [Thermomicrobiales bacterium]
MTGVFVLEPSRAAAVVPDCRARWRWRPAGDRDIVQLRSGQMLDVEADPELAEAFVGYPQAGAQFLAMNLAQKPFNDEKVRESFAYSVLQKI